MTKTTTDTIADLLIEKLASLELRLVLSGDGTVQVAGEEERIRSFMTSPLFETVKQFKFEIQERAEQRFRWSVVDSRMVSQTELEAEEVALARWNEHLLVER